MNKKIILIALVSALSVSLCSCGSKKSSSSNVSEAETSAPEMTTAELLELGDHFTLEDGQFAFSVPEGMTQTNNTEYDYTFQLTDDADSLLGITGVSGMHQTALGFGEGILADHEEAGFKNVEGTAYTFGDIPGYRITAIEDNGGSPLDYRMDLLQFGNGDIFCINTAAPEGQLADCASKIDTVMSSIEYLGAPLKTEPEVIENDRFKLTVPENLYIRDPSDDENVYIGYNLTQNDSEYISRFEITVMEDMTPEEAADTLYSQWEKNEKSSDRTKESVEFLGYDAIHMSQKLSFAGKNINSETYHLEAGGTTYWIMITTENTLSEQFKNDIQPVLDSIEFK